MASASKITSQAVGAFGEKAVEAELLRHGWIPANINATVWNAADFDIYASKNGRLVRLQVKTCGPGIRAFQFGGFDPGGKIEVSGFGDSDFTIFVSMADQRANDIFYLVPTGIVREEVSNRQRAWLSKSKRDGSPRKDVGLWTLRLGERRDKTEESGYGLEGKWKKYCDNWSVLE